MAATITFCYNPSSIFLGRNVLKPRSLNNTSFADSFSGSRSIFSGLNVLRKPVVGRNRSWVPNTMDESIISSVANTMDRSIRTSAFRDRSSDENIQVLQQETFIDESSEFRPKFLFHRELELTLNRLSKWIVASLFGGFILWRHDAEALWFAAGCALNSMLSLELKKILNQERPSNLKSDPGMPSSHSQSIFFTVLFVILSILGWFGWNKFTIGSSGLALALGSFFSYLRVSQQLHTVSQVAVGAAIGSIFSILWYWLWNAFVRDALLASLWVRIIVDFGGAGICLGFVIYAIRHWFDE